MIPSSSRGRAVLAVVALTCGCREHSDACVALSEGDLRLTAYLTDDGTRARTEIEVRRDDDDLAHGLCDGSALYVDGARATRVRRPSGASVYKVDVAVLEGDEVTRTLTLRDDDFRADYTATIDAPAFEFTAPEPGVELSRAATWDLAWTPTRPGAVIHARVSDVVDGEACLGVPIELELPDAGAAQISPGQLEVDAAGLPTVDRCEATIRLERVASTPLERSDGGGSRLHQDSRLVASTMRELAFTSVP